MGNQQSIQPTQRMAELEESPLRTLCEEVTCSICLDYFREPVMVDCGHNFCQSCISECFGEAEEEASCPQCRASVQPQNMKPNRPLASIVEISKKFSLQLSIGAKALGRVCEGHQEPLKLFCKDDQALICVVCDRSREHRGHQVIPKEEALEEYKDVISKRLNVLRQKRDATVSSRTIEETEKYQLLRQTEIERQRIVAEFKQMHKFLKEKERVLLAQLQDLEDVIKDVGHGHIAELSEEIESLEGFIVEMEEKQLQPEDDFLQDVEATLERCTPGPVKAPSTYPSKVKEEIQKFSEINVSLKAITKDFKDLFTTKLEDKNADRTEEIQVPSLQILSSTNFPSYWSYEQHFEQLRSWSYIVGTENITSGCQSWVVDTAMMRCPYWAFGLFGVDQTLHSRIWAIGKTNKDGPTVFTSDNVHLFQWPKERARKAAFYTSTILMTGKLRVSLDYKHGSIVFLNATNDTIHSFKNVIQKGEKICFWYGVGCINMPLKIEMKNNRGGKKWVWDPKFNLPS